jgi:hypothetical protein
MRRAVERPGEEADDEREPVALVAADRQQQPSAALRIGEGLALAVDHPAFGHRLAALRFVFTLP